MAGSILHKHAAPNLKHPKRISHRGLLTFAAGVLLVFVPYLVERLGYTGDVLIADERVGAPFDKSLVLIDQHGVEGAVGVILNRPLLDSQREQLSPFIKNEGVPIGYGGPIETTEKILVLEEIQPSRVGGKVRFDLEFWDDAVRMTPDLLRKIRQSGEDGEQRYRLFASYAYWNPFQLDSEALVSGDWFAIPANHDVVFQNGDAARWGALEKQEKSKKQSDLNQS
jgi:putative transcriptional regulator